MSKQLTIVFFARRFYPLIGGVEKHVLEISKRLVKKGFRVIVFTENEENTKSENYHFYPQSAKFEGIEIIRVKVGKNNRLKKFRIWFYLLKYIYTIKSADIIHCHDIFFWYLPFRFIFPFKRVYTTFHGYEGNDIPTKRAVFMHKVAEKLSNGNICIGSFYKKWYGTIPTYVSYGAVDVPDKSNINQQDKNLIIFLGRLEEETGIMEYLEAFKNISKKHKDLKMLVLGDGSLRKKSETFVKTNNLNVTFKGFILDTYSYIQRANFMFTSRYLGILESMVNKKYVLAVYNNKIKKDYLEMTPFSKYMSICANSEDILKELNEILGDKSFAPEKISKAYDWVKDQTWDNMFETYLMLWRLN